MERQYNLLTFDDTRLEVRLPISSCDGVIDNRSWSRIAQLPQTRTLFNKTSIMYNLHGDTKNTVNCHVQSSSSLSTFKHWLKTELYSHSRVKAWSDCVNFHQLLLLHL